MNVDNRLQSTYDMIQPVLSDNYYRVQDIKSSQRVLQVPRGLYCRSRDRQFET